MRENNEITGRICYVRGGKDENSVYTIIRVWFSMSLAVNITVRRGNKAVKIMQMRKKRKELMKNRCKTCIRRLVLGRFFRL